MIPYKLLIIFLLKDIYIKFKLEILIKIFIKKNVRKLPNKHRKIIF
jgi:hypothetical protein